MMLKQDWVAVGIKILGVYMAVLALVGAGSAGLNTIMTLIFSDKPDGVSLLKVSGVILIKVFLFGLIVPIVQGTVAWLLLKRTEWCLNKAGLGEEPLQM